MFSMKFETETGFKGTLQLEVPKNHERLALLAKHQVGRMRAGKDAKTPAQKNELFEINSAMYAAIYGDIRHLIKSVDLVRGEEKIQSVEQFETHADLLSGVALVALQYIEGFGPGKMKSHS